MNDVNVAAQATDTPDYAAEIARLSGDAVPDKVENVVPDTEEVAKVAESDTFDPATLSPTAKAQWDAAQKALETERRRAQDYEERFNRLHGKMGPLQTELNRLKKTTQRPANAPPAKAEPNKPVSRETLQHWVKHAKDYPEEAAAIEELLKDRLRDELGRFQPVPDEIAALRKELAELKEQQLYPLLEARENEVIAKAQNSVLEAHPDWSDNIRIEEEDGKVVITHVSDALQSWLDEQPDRIVAMFGSDDPKECIWVMNQFKRDQVKTEVAQADTSQQTAATQIQQQREKNLQSRAVASSSGNGVARLDPSKMSDAERYDLDMKKLMG